MEKRANGESQADLRLRPFSTRSRKGCIYCRKRHKRCDEKQPSCTSCLTRKKPCAYLPLPPLRDRRAQLRPGEQEPWGIQDAQHAQTLQTPDKPSSSAIVPLSIIAQCSASTSWQSRPGEAVDPFDALAIHMPLKSKELLHYFYQAGDAFDALPKLAEGHCIASAMDDPNALRNTLLISGLHYAWNVGDLRSFESTFLFHKIQSIRMVNTWLGKRSRENVVMLCVRNITTLCFTECCLGNLEAAECHLEGLMSYMDAQWPEEQDSNSSNSVECELSGRYLILAYNTVHSLKSRLDDYLTSFAYLEAAIRHWSPKEVGRLVYEWHLQEASGVALRLKAMWTFPSFFTLPPRGKLSERVDVRAIIVSLQNITRMYDARYNTTGQTDYDLWDSGHPSRLLLSVVDAHSKSMYCTLQPSARGEPSLESAWSGTCVAIGMYLTSVLGIWNQGAPTERRLLCYILRVLRSDLERSVHDLTSQREELQSLWLWKLVIGVISLDHAHGTVHDERLGGLTQDFTRLMRTSIQATGPSSWVELRKKLADIAWPANYSGEKRAGRLWDTTFLET